MNYFELLENYISTLNLVIISRVSKNALKVTENRTKW